MAGISAAQMRAKRRLAKIKRRESWRRNPMKWLEERMGEDPKDFYWSLHEGYENHEWDGTINPLAEAWLSLAKAYTENAEGELPTHKNVAVESGTGTGKTYLLARIVVWYLDVFEDALVITSAPSDNQLKMGLWAEISKLYPRIKGFRPNAKKWQLRLAMEWQVQPWMTEQQKLELEANSWHAKGFVTGTSSNKESEDKARGFHRKHMLIILEECTGIPISILTAFQNTCTGNTNFILAVGNPNNEFDPLHQFAEQKDCLAIRASSLDHPNIVLQKEVYAGAITQSSINSRTDNYGEDSPLWQAMVRGLSPAQASDSLIKKEWVDACIDTYHAADPSYNAVGVDVANSTNGDKAALAFGRDNTLEEVQEFYCKNATHLAYNLYKDDAELDRLDHSKYDTSKLSDYEIEGDCIGVDSVGVGVATVNAFLDDGFPVQSLSGGQWNEVIPLEEHWVGGKKVERPMYRFPNLRAQMYWELREDIRQKRLNIRIEGDDKTLLTQLIKELCIPKFKANDTMITVEGKEDIKKRMGGKSPNIADAIVYWNWTRKGYRIDRRGFAAFGTGD